MADAKKILSEWGLLLLILAFGLFLRVWTNPAPLTGIIGADGLFHSWLVSETVSSGAFPSLDPFSWGGRLVSYFPGFHFLFSAILLSSGISNFLSQGFALSLAGPALFALAFFALAVFSKKSGIRPEITCAIFSAIPILFWKTSMNFLPDALTIALAIFMLFIEKNSPGPLTYFLLLAGVLSHPIFALVAVASLAYGFRKGFFVRSLLTVSFAILTAVAIIFFIGKTMPLPSPDSVLSQGIPERMKAEIFEGFDIGKIAYRIGPAILPFLLAFPMNFFGFLSFLVPAGLLIIELDRVLVFSAILLLPAAATFISKRKRFAQTLFVLVILAWALFSMKALSWAPLSKGDFNSLGWISENSKDSLPILSLPGDGYLVAYLSKRKNSIDGRFSGSSGGDARLDAVFRSIDAPSANPPPSGERYLLISSRTSQTAPAREWSLICESKGKEGVYSSPYRRQEKS